MGKIRNVSLIGGIYEDCRDGDIPSSVLIKYTVGLSVLTQFRTLFDGFVGQIHANILKLASKAQSTQDSQEEPLLTSMSLPRQNRDPNTSCFLFRAFSDC